MPSHYELLEVLPSATQEEIHRAYLDKARRLHPDALVGASPDVVRRSARAMQSLNEAWHVLRDPARRRKYDGELDLPSPARRPDVGPDDEPIANDWVSANLAEGPVRRSRPADLAMLAPAALIVAGVGLLVFATMTMSAAVLALAFGCLVLAGASFAVAPLWVMSRERRRPSRGS